MPLPLPPPPYMPQLQLHEEGARARAHPSPHNDWHHGTVETGPVPAARSHFLPYVVCALYRGIRLLPDNDSIPLLVQLFASPITTLIKACPSIVRSFYCFNFWMNKTTEPLIGFLCNYFHHIASVWRMCVCGMMRQWGASRPDLFYGGQ